MMNEIDHSFIITIQFFQFDYKYWSERRFRNDFWTYNIKAILNTLKNYPQDFLLNISDSNFAKKIIKFVEKNKYIIFAI